MFFNNFEIISIMVFLVAVMFLTLVVMVDGIRQKIKMLDESVSSVARTLQDLKNKAGE